jgi:hypothetical protein
MLRKSFLWTLLALTGLATAVAMGEARLPDPVPHVSIPDAVRMFMSRNYPNATAAINDRVQEDAQFRPEYSLLWYSRATNFGADHEVVWLVGYRLGIWSGSGQMQDDHVALIDDYGRDVAGPRLLRGKDRIIRGGDDGVMIRVRQGAWAAVMTQYGRRPYQRGSTRIWTLEEEPKELLTYDCPERPWWYSTLYFLDTDADGATDILVDRTVRDFDRKVKWREYRIYRFDEKLSRYAEAERITRTRFDELLAKAGGAPAVPHLEQSGPPFEISLDEALKVIDEPLQQPAVPPVEHHDGKTR